MLLSKEIIELLDPFKSILEKMDFKKPGNIYIDSSTKKQLADIYQKATCIPVCGSCNNDFIKRLSFWYFESVEYYKCLEND